MLPMLRVVRQLDSSNATRDTGLHSPSSKSPVKGILDQNYVVATDMPLPAHDGTHTPNIATARHHAHSTSIKLDEVGHLVVLKIEFHSVVHADIGVGVPQCPSVVGDDVRHTAETKSNPLDLKELVLGLLIGDAVDQETALDVVDDAEVLVGLLDRNDVCPET